jgi:hypothetical protein
MYHFNALNFGLFTITIVISIFNSSFAVTQNIEVKSFSENLISLEFPLSPGSTVKSPQSTAASGLRPGETGKLCFPDVANQEKLQLTSLMPNTENQAQTISSQPSLFVYIPKTNANSATFSLKNSVGKVIIDSQEISLNNTNTSGVILKITLRLETELKINQIYHWTISVNCLTSNLYRNGISRENGIIQRVKLKPEVESQLSNTEDALGKAKIYAHEGIWLDTLTTLASVRDSQPEEWRELLESVGLEKLSDKPLRASM